MEWPFVVTVVKKPESSRIGSPLGRKALWRSSSSVVAVSGSSAHPPPRPEVSSSAPIPRKDIVRMVRELLAWLGPDHEARFYRELFMNFRCAPKGDVPKVIQRFRKCA